MNLDPNSPQFIENTTEVNECTECKVICYFMPICSSCQVRRLIASGDSENWTLSYACMWASRLGCPVPKTVYEVTAHVGLINSLRQIYSVTITYKDFANSSDSRMQEYTGGLTKKNADKLAAKLHGTAAITLNGEYWESI